MNYRIAIAGLLLASSSIATAQVHWPSSSGECSCLRIGPQLGTTIFSSWSQTETFVPSVPGSPLRAFEGTRDAPLFPGSWYAGVDVSVRAGASTRLNIDLGYAYDRFTFDDNTADVDVTAASSPNPVLGQVQQTDVRGHVGYLEIGLALEKEFPSGIYAYLGLAVRSRATDLALEWNEEIISPASATFVGSVTNVTTRSQALTLGKAAQVRYGPQAGVGYRWKLGGGVYLNGALGLNYWFPRVAEDEIVLDQSRALTAGTADARLTKRDLQNILSLRIGCSFDL